jgi:hypothetical protein
MSEVLVDTSVWVEFFREPDSNWGRTVELLLGEKRVCTTPLVMVEVISGARTRSEFHRLKKDFEALPRLEPPADLWDQLLESRWQLKNRGISGVSIPDLIVAHTALAHQKTILTRDQDFQRMQRFLDFKLFQLS